ncbi:MAG: T9SS type A sorting domain-containing protein [Saprospiraceae bacterium]|jgi:hypothetical protein|nr:T9SS type A sorting domain-containing protein [Saprospiraceae bacterium]MBV6474138.1 hypothetical protein [Saprospiraceae bacterium]
MKAFPIYLIFYLYTIQDLFSQIDPLGDVFLNSQPIWSHVAIDSSAIGYKGRTGMDYFSLSEYKILVVQNSAYLIYSNIFEGYSGTFIEKIDINTGRCFWSNFIDLRNSIKRERTKRFFINKNGDLELLNLRQSADTLISGINDWLTGKLAIHKYDTLSGTEKYVSYSVINDTNYLEFSLDYKSTLRKNESEGYDCYTIWYSPTRNSLGISRIKMDSVGKFLSVDASAEIFKKYLNGYAYEDLPFFINEEQDTLVRVSHTFKNYPYIQGDSLELSIYYFDKDLKELRKYDISPFVTQVKEYQILPQRGSILLIRSTDYFNDNSAPRRRIISVNPTGLIEEEIFFQNKMLDRYGDFDSVLKLKNSLGSLILSRNKFSDSPSQFNFYKSDGNGNMVLALEVPLKNSYNIYNSKMEQLDNGNVILSGRYRRRDVNPGEVTLTERFITSLWDAKMLQINVATNEEKGQLNIYTYPNPAVNEFQIKGIHDKDSDGYLFDESGKIIRKYYSITSDSKYSIKSLLPGKYFIQIINRNNQLLFLGTIVKI